MARDLIGQQLGNYELVSLIGRSSFAEVYLGQHAQTSTQAAIKILHTHLSPTKIKEFKQEAEMICSLVHPHIVRTLDFGVSDGIPFLVIDYYSHGSLRQHHPKGEHISLSIVVSYITQIADALQYAHGQKHIHHNVKPENILIGQHDDVLLSDFGIAATAQNTFFMSRQAFVGSPPYMAPEQIKLHRRRESDQYALAIVTYELLTGKLPFLGTPEEIATKHLSAEPPSLRQKLPNLPISVEEVVFKALAKEPKERFPSVQDFATALQDACQTKSSTSSSPELSATSSQLIQSPASTQSAVIPVEALTEKADTSDTLSVTTSTPIAEINSEPEEDPDSSTLTDINSQAQEPNLLTPIPSNNTNSQVEDVNSPTLNTTINFNPTSEDTDSITLTPTNNDNSQFDENEASTFITTTPETTTYIEDVDSSNSLVSDSNSQADADPSMSITTTSDTTAHKESVDTYIETSDSSSNTTAADSNTPIEDVTDTNVPIEEPDSYTPTIIADINAHLESEPATTSTVTDTRVPDEAEPPIVITIAEPDTQASSQFAKKLRHASKQPSSLRPAPWRKFTRRQVLIGLLATGVVGGIIWEIADLRPSPSPSNPQLRYTYTGHSWTVYTVDWSPDGKRIASGASDDTVQVWDATTGENAYSYQEHTDTVYSVAWSPNGQRIASGSNDKTVQVWNAVNGGDAYSYHGHSDTVYNVAWSPDGQSIASASADKTVQVWNATTGSQIYIYHGHTDAVYGLAWSPDGKRIASGGRDDTVQVWDATTGSNVTTYHGHTDAINSIAWSPNGNLIASGSYDHTVHIWTPTTGGDVYVYQGHTNVVNAVAWSSDNKRIASASNDKTAQVWNATDGSNAYTYHGHTNIVETVAWSPDEQLIASGSWDGTVQVWQAS